MAGIRRIERYQKDGVEPQYPDPGPASYLLAHLWEIGPTEAAGAGEGPISQSEIRAWQENMGVELHPWEVSLLRRLSGEYLSQSQKSTNPACPPPFGALYRAPNLSKKIDSALD